MNSDKHYQFLAQLHEIDQLLLAELLILCVVFFLTSCFSETFADFGSECSMNLKELLGLLLSSIAGFSLKLDAYEGVTRS